MAPTSDSTTPLTARCQCQANSFTFDVKPADLPLSAYHCHCNKCRHAAGVLFPSFVSLPEYVAPPLQDAISPAKRLTTFESSENVTRFFCTNCGSHMVEHYHSKDEDSWTLCTGTLDVAQGVIKYSSHRQLQPCIDAGMDLSSVVNDGLPRYALDGADRAEILTDDMLEALHVNSSGTSTAASASSLPLHCFCKSVSMHLKHPSATHHPWVDDNDMWVTADKQKWRVLHCMCSDCRLASGHPAISYVVPPTTHVEWVKSEGMRTWSSSTGIQRSFCTTCGATVLYERDDRPGIYHLAIGLADPANKDGERLLDWIIWGPGIDPSGGGKAYHEELRTALQDGNKRWHARQKKERDADKVVQ